MESMLIWRLLLSSFILLHGHHANELNFRKMCSNLKGTFSMSNSKLIAATIREGETTTAFVNEAPEFVFECKSNHKHNPTNTSWPEIKFEKNQKLNHQVNSYGGNLIITIMGLQKISLNSPFIRNRINH